MNLQLLLNGFDADVNVSIETIWDKAQKNFLER
jgi:hypothetical protein